MKNALYQLNIASPAGIEIPMSDFEGKVILVVNTATQCGLTPQFEGLEDLHQKYKDQGLVVLGFPCDQFGGQEPESNETVEQVCKVNHGVSFQLTQKCDVNGSNAHPVFKYLKTELGGLFGSRIKWNFTKFLIAKDGKPYKRFSPITKPESIEKDIRKLLR